MADARPGRPVQRKPAARKRGEGKVSESKVSTPSLRKLARAHTEAALQVLAEVAVKGSSEASRISAAMALLDRGYGKSGTGQASEGSGRPPTLYKWIELVDGTKQNCDAPRPGDDQATDRQD